MWMESVYQLIENKRDQAAAEVVLGALDRAFSNGEFEVIDRLLPQIDLSKLDSANILCFIAYTFHAKEHLSNRPAFVERCEVHLNTTIGKDRTARLLQHRR